MKAEITVYGTHLEVEYEHADGVLVIERVSPEGHKESWWDFFNDRFRAEIEEKCWKLVDERRRGI